MAINFYSDIHLAANKLGRDADNLLDFSTDNEITFRVGAGDGVIFKASGEIEATSLDISGDVDVDGTLETDALTVGGTNVLTGSLITTLGTISAGVWNGTAIASAYLDSDTAHLTTAQTFTGSKTMGTDVKLNFRDGNSYIHSPSANDLEIVCTDLVIDTSNSVAIETSDLTMYDPVNGGNPTLSIGSSATNRFEIKTAYNSSAQTIDEVYFSTYTTSSTTNDGRYIFEVDEVELVRFLDAGLAVTGDCYLTDADARYSSTDTTASSATQGGKIQLNSNDGAAMGSGHRLGVIEFKGAEDASSTMTIGARIEAICDAAWSASENGADLVFYTTDGNASESEVMRATASTGVSIPKRKFAVSSTTDGNVGSGDIVYFGSGSVTLGKIYHYKSDGSWEVADANDVTKCDGLLGVATATGTASDVGMLLRGTITIVDIQGSEAVGDVLYLSESATGEADCVAPAGSSDVVRIIGYCLSTDDQIWFNPSPDFIVLA